MVVLASDKIDPSRAARCVQLGLLGSVLRHRFQAWEGRCSTHLASTTCNNHYDYVKIREGYKPLTSTLRASYDGCATFQRVISMPPCAIIVKA